MDAVVMWMGYRQTLRHGTGIEDLYFDVVEKVSPPETVLSLPDRWNADVVARASQLSRRGVRNVIMISYSHGQAAATSFARHAAAIGLHIPLWLSCDGIYRPPWLPRIDALQWVSARALIPESARIIAPPNIKRVVYTVQKMDLPQGHRIDPSPGSNTKVEFKGFLPYGHSEIDDSPEWFEMVEEELRGYFYPPRAISIA